MFFGSFAVKKLFSAEFSKMMLNARRKLRAKSISDANAIWSPQKSEFRMGFPEVTPAIHKHDARTIGLALVQNSPSRTQANNLSGND